MKKVTKVFLIGVAVDIFYGHLFAIWRKVNPKNFNAFFDQKDKFYERLGVDKLWKKED